LTFGNSPGIVGAVSEDSVRPLGEWLRQRREESGISLEQAETDTRIRLRYLEALEAEDFEALPDPGVGRGFLRNYAAYLGLDPQEASQRYSAMVAPPQPESLPAKDPSPLTSGPFRPVPLHDMPGWNARRRSLIGLLVILVVALGLLGWWAYPRVGDLLAWLKPAPKPTPTQRATLADLPTATHTATATAVVTLAAETITPTLALPTLELTSTPTFTPSPVSSPSPPIYTGIFLELVFTDTSWIQITVDGVRQFQGELEAATYRSWYGEERIELRVGNAGAVEVTVNGQKLGALGAVGDVVDRVFEKVGDQISESTPTPSITGTLTVEPTAVPTVRPAVAPPTPTLTPTVPLTTTAPSPTPGQ
jgi:cytoskeleton protein RodZ